MRCAVAVLVCALAWPLAAAEQRVIGLASDDATHIEAFVAEGRAGAGGVLLIGGLGGDDASSTAVRAQVAQPDAPALAIPVANPKGATLEFPPKGVAYRENTESWVLWNWIGLQAPDLVLIVGDDPGGLAVALGSNAAGGVGKIPALRVDASEVAAALHQTVTESEAHIEMDRRRARKPQELANELSQYFGHNFDQLTYIPGVALLAQMRLGNYAEVEQLAAPYMDPTKDTLARASSLTLAGHMVFAVLAKRTGDVRYRNLVQKVANLGFASNGEMLPSMPFHGEMSDSYFMAGPIVAMAGTLTGETRYFDLVARHFHYMDKLVLRDDGLFRHSPLTDAAWGRGNAFPALGLALALSEFPPSHPEYRYIRDSYRRLMITLAKYQDEDGMWHEIIDEPGSYAETSATSMIATAMLRGIRRGWLDAREYTPKVDKAYQGVLARIGPLGELIDVCESTNKQSTRADYLHRAALQGQDPRGGAMAFFFATEMAGLE